LKRKEKQVCDKKYVLLFFNSNRIFQIHLFHSIQMVSKPAQLSTQKTDTMPRGPPKSGRVWKEVRTER